MINNPEGSSILGASLFTFLDIKRFSTVQTTLANISYYTLQKEKEN